MTGRPVEHGAQQAVRTPLARLRERVTRFPARREEVKRLETLEQLARHATEFRAQVVRVRTQQSHISFVFADCDTSESARALLNVQARAEGLERVLASGPEAWDADTRRPLQDLKRAVEGATGAVQREWRREVDDVVAKYERLGSALLKAGLDDGAAIGDALGRVRRLSEPPVLEREAQRASELVRSVPAAVARLGASGVVADFLVAALDGRATAQSLREPAVVKFLDSNRLWDLLRVSIR